jgi:hypothetical protein
MHQSFIMAISQALNADPKTKNLTQAQHYREIEKRLTAEMPNLLTKYVPGKKPAAAATALSPAAAPAAPAKTRVTSPATMSEIPNGVSPSPAKPLDLSGKSAIELAMMGSQMSERDYRNLRADRARQAARSQ